MGAHVYVRAAKHTYALFVTRALKAPSAFCIKKRQLIWDITYLFPVQSVCIRWHTDASMIDSVPIDYCFPIDLFFFFCLRVPPIRVLKFSDLQSYARCT